MKHVGCAYCSHDIREGDDIVVMYSGVMTVDEETQQLFCCVDEYSGGDLAELVYHEDCFSKGPEEIEPDLLQCGRTLKDHLYPRCSICDEVLMEEDRVLMLRCGSVFRMDLDDRPFYVMSEDGETFHVFALYSHTDCVSAEIIHCFADELMAGVVPEEESEPLSEHEEEEFPY